MYHFWKHIIRPALETVQPRSIVEIGCADGRNTANLLEFCTQTGAHLHVIDTLPNLPTDQWPKKYQEHLTLHQDLSLHALREISDYDAVLIDGDHNWYTVYHELLLLEKHAADGGHFPLVLLHDVCWPYGRRDLYYDAATIPQAYRHPSARKGMNPGSVRLVDEGGMNPDLENALEENGPRNGVRTAVEDFLKQSPLELRFVVVPGWHGLGIIADRALLERHHSLRRFLDELEPGDAIRRHIEEVERGRIAAVTWQAKKNDVGARQKEEEDALHEEHRHLVHVVKRLRDKRDLWQQAYDVQREHYLRLIEGERMGLREKLQTILPEHERRVRELEAQLQHLQQTRSWRWTRPLRIALDTGGIRKQAYDIWLASGQPFPRLARAVRYKLLGKWWPAAPQIPPPSETQPVVPESEILAQKVAVVIPCHNYGRFLAQAVESVLRQTLPAAEVVIVDDSSTDDTAEVARTFLQKGVTFIRGDWKSVGLARNAGMELTTAPFLVFLDADDILHPDYLREGVRALLQNPGAGIAYPDLQLFGNNELFYRTPETFNPEQFDRRNILSSVSMVRRDALESAGKWSLGANQHADWVTWRRILQAGWTAVKSSGLCFYRSHEKNMYGQMRDSVSYAKRAGLVDEPATLCIALSGRSWAWPLTAAFLERQTFPHDRIHLIVQDTSQNPQFGKMVRDWLAQSDYLSHAYVEHEVGIKGLAQMNREIMSRQVADACVKIYNRFARLCTTPLVFFLEDDIVPPDDAYLRLTDSLKESAVSVSGFYRHRLRNDALAWYWNKDGSFSHAIPLEGVTEVGGNGFGCVVMRGETLRRTVFTCHAPHWHYDLNFYHDAVEVRGSTALVDWSCICKHYLDADTWQ